MVCRDIQIQGVPPNHEHLGLAMDRDRLRNIDLEKRQNEARVLKPKVR
jgi:hypothetical protein